MFAQKDSILDAWGGSEYACVHIASNNVLFHHNKRLIWYFEFLYDVGVIILPLNIPEKLHWQHPFEKPEEAETHRLYLSYFNTVPKHPNEQYLPLKQTGTTTLVSFDTNPVFGHVLIHFFFWQNSCSSCSSGIYLVVVLEYTFFQLSSNAEQISVRLTRFRRSYVKRPLVILTSNTNYATFLLDVCCAVKSGHVPFFAAVCPQW